MAALGKCAEITSGDVNIVKALELQVYFYVVGRLLSLLETNENDCGQSSCWNGSASEGIASLIACFQK